MSADSLKYQPKIKKIDDLEEKQKQAEQLSEKLKADTIGNASRKLRLEKQTDSIYILSAKVNELTSAVTDLEGFKTANMKHVTAFNNFYEASFAELLKTTSLDRLKSDSQTFTTLFKGTAIPQKINNLLIYKQAELLFISKHDKAKTEATKRALQPIMSLEGTRQLAKALDDYESLTNNLINTLNRIQQANALKAEKNEDLINGKKDKVLRAIEDCVYYNDIDLTRYIYLDQIITAVKKRKMKDIDADIQDLIKQLLN